LFEQPGDKSLGVGPYWKPWIRLRNFFLLMYLHPNLVWYRNNPSKTIKNGYNWSSTSSWKRHEIHHVIHIKNGIQSYLNFGFMDMDL
jgi:hypothetical protein